VCVTNAQEISETAVFALTQLTNLRNYIVAEAQLAEEVDNEELTFQERLEACKSLIAMKYEQQL